MTTPTITTKDTVHTLKPHMVRTGDTSQFCLFHSFGIECYGTQSNLYKLALRKQYSS